jgi:manganese/zinc/iron transport system substrate-binding protein
MRLGPSSRPPSRPPRRRTPVTGARLAILALSIGALGFGCGRDPAGVGAGVPDSGSAPRLRVVCTVGMVADVVRHVAGDRVEVVGLVPTGVDPHLYAPTRSDLARVRDADLVFSNGLRLEGRMTDALDRVAAAGTPVVPVAERIAVGELLAAEEHEGAPDPHVWMDPRLWAQAVEAIRDALADEDPDHATIYRENADAYLETLAAVDAYAAEVLASVPADRRVLITSHDAFNYFGRRFDFEVLGIQGISTESEAGVRDIEALVDLLVDRGIAAVFVESTVGNRHVEALLVGARAQGHDVSIGGSLFSDAMGETGTYEGTYLGMIDHNATTVARGLGGIAPSGGMRGRLAASGDAAEASR